jgi:hypothetical protein
MHADALGIPRHTKTAKHRSHNSYSKYIRDELNAIFMPMQKEVEDCNTVPVYRKSKKKIESLSKLAYGNILLAHPAGYQHLDDIPQHFLMKALKKK